MSIRNQLMIWCTALFLPVIARDTAVRAAGQEKEVRVTVENPGSFARKHETIAVPLREVRGRLKGTDALTFRVVQAATGTPVACQVAGEELLFQADFRPLERREFLIARAGAAEDPPPSVVDGRFVLPREDYAWENDRIAFRVYGPAMARDVNNGIDVWTKRVRYPIVAKWYRESEGSAPGKDTYHQDRGEGADFFAVGKTLGAGGSGLWRGGAVAQPGVFLGQRTIANGPLRVEFELTYTWSLDGRQVVEHKRIALDAGENLNRVQVMFEPPAGLDTCTIACGLVKRAGTTLRTGGGTCWMGLWGLTTADTVNGYLGTGVVAVPGACLTYGEDKDQYLLLARTKGKGPFTYYAGAGWTRSGDYATEREWMEYLEAFAKRIAAPLSVRLGPGS